MECRVFKSTCALNLPSRLKVTAISHFVTAIGQVAFSHDSRTAAPLYPHIRLNSSIETLLGTNSSDGHTWS